MSLSDRELIVHWQLRHHVVCFSMAAIMCAIAAALGFLGALLPPLRSEGLAAGIFFSFIGAACAWRLIRLWRRLRALEDMIP